jgi:hypothetical protein
MGCTESKVVVNNEVSGFIPPSNIRLFIDDKLLCRDEFTVDTEITGKKVLHKWRLCTIIEVKTYKVKIHFDGWKKTFDKWIDLGSFINYDENELNHKKFLLAPIGLLNQHQINSGVALTLNQYKSCIYFIINGEFPQIESKIKHEQGYEEKNELEAPVLNLKNTFKKGDKVDVKNNFSKDANSGSSATKKWRPCRVISVVNKTYVLIHYVGLDDKWNEVLNIANEDDYNRIRESGTMTSLQTNGKAKSDSKNILYRRRSFEERIISTPTLTRPDKLSPRCENKNFSIEENNSIMIKNDNNDSLSSNIDQAEIEYGDQKLVDSFSKTSNMSIYNNLSSNESINTSSKKKKKIGRRRSSFPAQFRGRASEDIFVDRMEFIGLHVVEVEGDGNCLFRAISHQMHMHEDHHSDLRKSCVKHMDKYRTRFAPFCPINFDDHLRHMMKPTTWGDDLEIRALEEILDRVIVIYSAESKEYVPIPLKTNFEEQLLLKGISPIILSYHGQSHYNSVFDQKHSLPLSKRRSNILLNSREIKLT